MLSTLPAAARASENAGAAAWAGVETLLGHLHVLPLILAGLMLARSLAGRPPRACASAAGALIAAAIAGIAAGAVAGPAFWLDAAISGAGAVLGGFLVADLRRPVWLGVAPAAVLLALLGAWLGGVAGTGGAPASFVAAYTSAAAVAVTLGALLAGAGRWQAGQIGMRIAGGWSAAVLILASGLTLSGTVGGAASPLVAAAPVRTEASLSDREIRAVLVGVLSGVYLAFEKQEETAIYDALAAVADGEVVTDLYLQKRRALVLRDPEDTGTKVHGVDLEVFEATPVAGGGGYAVSAVWRVHGAVGHWGHSHERTNRYTADLVLAPADGTWKLTSFTLREVVREPVRQ